MVGTFHHTCRTQALSASAFLPPVPFWRFFPQSLFGIFSPVPFWHVFPGPCFVPCLFELLCFGTRLMGRFLERSTTRESQANGVNVWARTQISGRFRRALDGQSSRAFHHARVTVKWWEPFGARVAHKCLECFAARLVSVQDIKDGHDDALRSIAAAYSNCQGLRRLRKGLSTWS